MKNSALRHFQHERPLHFIRNRFFALVIDFIIVALICQLAFNLFGTPDWNHYLRTQEIVRDLPRTDPLVIERTRLYQECFIVSLGIAFLYESLMLVFFRGTIGKLVYGFRVINMNENINFIVGKLLFILRTAIRLLSIYLLASLPFIFLCLTAFSNEESRSGFDMFSGTKVISTRNRRK